MLKMEYKLKVPGHSGAFCDMIRRFNNSNNSLYISLIPELFDFKTDTIYLNILTVTLFSRILEDNEEEVKNLNNILFKEVFDICKELLDCYMKVWRFENNFEQERKNIS